MWALNSYFAECQVDRAFVQTALSQGALITHFAYTTILNVKLSDVRCVCMCKQVQQCRGFGDYLGVRIMRCFFGFFIPHCILDLFLKK